MKKNDWLHPMVLACGVLFAACGVAHASPPVERIVCTTLPGEAWLGEEKIKAIFGMQDYLRVDFKISRTHCYEFYAIKKNGDVVEAYYHPVTGKIVKRSVQLNTTDPTAPTAATEAAKAGSTVPR